MIGAAPSGEQFEIAWADQSATVVEVGGGLRGYRAAGREVVAGYPEGEMADHGSGQILAPWPNRIADGRYRFGGRQCELPLNEQARGNASHGLVRWARWQVVDRSASSVTLVHRLPPQPGYPYQLDLSVRWSVGPDGLLAEHTAVNTGTTDCPYGLGVHPYLRPAGCRLDDAWLELPATDRLLVDDRLLPAGLAALAGDGVDDIDFGKARQIGATALDVAYTGLARDGDGRAWVTLSGPGGVTEWWCGPQFGWVQLFTADGTEPSFRRTAIACEPMTCPPDAFNSGTDLVVLAPGGSHRAVWGVRTR